MIFSNEVPLEKTVDSAGGVTAEILNECLYINSSKYKDFSGNGFLDIVLNARSVPAGEKNIIVVNVWKKVREEGDWINRCWNEESFCFLKIGDTVLPIDGSEANDTDISGVLMAEDIDGRIYFQLGRKGIFILSYDGKLKQYESADFKKAYFIGEINGKPLLDMKAYHDKNVAVDGFYTLEPDGSLKKFYPYVYHCGGFVAGGALYLIDDSRLSFINTDTGEELSYCPEKEEVNEAETSK